MDSPGPVKADEDRQKWLVDKYTEIASLAGGLAHEIKNPLSTLVLNLQLLAEDFADPQSQKDRRALQKILTLQRECKRLEEILNDFLRFARVGELHRSRTDINALLRELIEFHAPQLEVAGILLRADLPPALPTVLLDRDIFKQALVNLLLNAQQAMPAGGELIIRTWADEAALYLVIIDTGVGMSPEVLGKIFRPFFSTRPGGSGLGLATTKKIIEAHGGRLNVESEPGKGTAFTLQLPLADASD